MRQSCLAWTSTITAVCFMYITYLFFYEKHDPTSFMTAGLAVGIAFATRIGDIIPTLTALLLLLADYIIKNKTNRRQYAIIAMTMGVVIAITSATIFVNYIFSGSLFGPYINNMITKVGFNIDATIYKLYGYLINSFTFERMGDYLSKPLLKYYFLFILTPLGLYEMISKKETRKKATYIILCTLSWLMIYTPHVALSGLTLSGGSLHYLKMFFPLFTLAAMKWLITLTEEKDKNLFSNNMRIMALYTVVILAVLFLIMQLRFLPVDMSKVKVDASENNDRTVLAIDGNMDTRWDTGTPQKLGMFYKIEFDRDYFINRIQLDTSPSPQGYPRGIEAYYSKDGVKWSHIDVRNIIRETPGADIYFDPVQCRYLKLVLTMEDKVDWWSIHEIRVWSR